MVPLRPLIVPIMASLDAVKPGSILGTVAAGDVGCPDDKCDEGRLELGSCLGPGSSLGHARSRFKLVERCVYWIFEDGMQQLHRRAADLSSRSDGDRHNHHHKRYEWFTHRLEQTKPKT